jgi:hypothetical protein
VLLVGGDRIVNGQRNYANNDVNLFTPADNKLTKQSQAMAYQRWYATLITTATGEQAVIGGRVDRAYEGNAQFPPTVDSYASTPEVYSATQGWRTLTTAANEWAYGSKVQAWNYPKAWWSPQGKVLVFTVKGEFFALDVAGTGSVAKVPGVLPLGAYNLPAAMYQPGKVLSVRADAKAVVVDINNATPVVTPTASLSADRRFGNATVLADGKVWVNSPRCWPTARYGSMAGPRPATTSSARAMTRRPGIRPRAPGRRPPRPSSLACTTASRC